MAAISLAPAPRIAILEADVPMPELEAKYGKYGDFFNRLLTDGAKAASLPIPKCTAWDILNNPDNYPDPSQFDAILVTGSRIISKGILLNKGYSAYEDKEWIHKLSAYVKKVYEEYPSKKIIGICFGHQIIAQALGGKVELNSKGWEMAVRTITLLPEAKGLFDLKDNVMVS